MDPKRKTFYLGRKYDLAKATGSSDPVMYDPANLTTHGVVTGMTGSGKTGLCIGLLEEAALQGIPALIVDPKGDLTNLVLHFPNLAPDDFEPWIDQDMARRSGKSVAELAVETAANWTQGLAGSELGPEDLRALQAAADFAIYTPGSSAGLPINILSSFQPPDIDWTDNREILREKISTTVTALLGLVGLTDIDPLRSREHILLSNVLENAWSKNQSLDLTELILQTQNPPFERLGAFPLDSFYPARERFDLAMLLNNFLASPSFETWLEGTPLDIEKFLYTPDGRIRHSIFYLTHLSDNERMFFTTLLFAATEAWMRTQRGTSGLRALLYFDEILGYLPPVANPPSKPILLRMLKQARAFGLGLLLATQNPVDVDYKALSNAGTWFIGRLQTDQDKQRLLDGLQSAAGGIDRAEFDRMISTLPKRTFILHNVHAKGPQVFQTRWVMNYLAGPLMRAQIPALNALVGKINKGPVETVTSTPVGASYATPSSGKKPASAATATITGSQVGTTSTRPPVPSGVAEYFLPDDLGVSEAIGNLNIDRGQSVENQGVVYHPALLLQAEARYMDRKYNLDFVHQFTSLLEDLPSGLVRWEDFASTPVNNKKLKSNPMPQTRFVPLPGWLTDAKRLSALQKDFIDWIYRSGGVQVRSNPALKIFAGPEVSAAEFRELCSKAAKQAYDEEAETVIDKFEAKQKALAAKISRQEQVVDGKKDAVSSRNVEGLAAGGELLLSLLGGRKKSLSNSLSKARMTKQAKAALKQEQEELEQLELELNDLEAEQAAALKDLQDRWAGVVNDIDEVTVTPAKKDIYMDLYGLVWLPFYVFDVDGKLRETPAFALQEK